MPQKRQDAEYLMQRIRELYKNHTAKEVAEILTRDPNIVAPVTERVVFNNLQKIRRQTEEQRVGVQGQAVVRGRGFGTSTVVRSRRLHSAHRPTVEPVDPVGARPD